MSSSAISRFRNRKYRSPMLDVAWPLDTKEIVFKVAQFSQAEQSAASFMAEGLLRKSGLEKTSPVWEEEIQNAFYHEMAEIVKRHIKGWEHKPTDGSEPVPFSTGTLEAVFQDMTVGERMQLGMAYLLAKIEDDKKKDEAGATPTDSAS